MRAMNPTETRWINKQIKQDVNEETFRSKCFNQFNVITDIRHHTSRLLFETLLHTRNDAGRCLEHQMHPLSITRRRRFFCWFLFCTCHVMYVFGVRTHACCPRSHETPASALYTFRYYIRTLYTNAPIYLSFPQSILRTRFAAAKCICASCL